MSTSNWQTASAMCADSTPRPCEDRNQAILTIRKALRARSGKAWSVRGGKGTSWGWITITAPPVRTNEFGSMNDEDIAELSELLGTPAHHQGVKVPSSMAYRQEYIDRAQGKTPTTIGTPYWD